MKKSNHLEYLKKEDLVAIVSIAKHVTQDKCQLAAEYIRKSGLHLVDLNYSMLPRKGMFSGSDEQRTKILQSILDNEKVKAIFFARGGYGSIRIIDNLNFDKFLKYPKWLIGFSDITVFLSHISANFNMPSIHSPMPFNFQNTSKKSIQELFNLLFGVTNFINLKSSKYNKKGTAKGKLIGGNLSILCSLLNSKSFYKTRGKILFIEDVGEYLYSIDRMMQSLRRSGVFNNLSGLIVGKFTNVKDNKPIFGQNIHEIILQVLEDFDFPICFNFPVGHQKKNTPLIINRNIKLEVDNFVKFSYT